MPPVTFAVALVVPASSGAALALTLTAPEFRIVPEPVVVASGPLA